MVRWRHDGRGRGGHGGGSVESRQRHSDNGVFPHPELKPSTFRQEDGGYHVQVPEPGGGHPSADPGLGSPTNNIPEVL